MDIEPPRAVEGEDHCVGIVEDGGVCVGMVAVRVDGVGEVEDGERGGLLCLALMAAGEDEGALAVVEVGDAGVVYGGGGEDLRAGEGV